MSITIRHLVGFILGASWGVLIHLIAGPYPQWGSFEWVIWLLGCLSLGVAWAYVLWTDDLKRTSTSNHGE